MQIAIMNRGVPTYLREGVLKRKVHSLAGGLGGRSHPDSDDNMAVTLPQITIILLLSFIV